MGQNYNVLQSEYIAELIDEVNDWLEDGWILQGGLAVVQEFNGSRFYQAMTLLAPKEATPSEITTHLLIHNSPMPFKAPARILEWMRSEGPKTASEVAYFLKTNKPTAQRILSEAKFKHHGYNERRKGVYVRGWFVQVTRQTWRPYTKEDILGPLEGTEIRVQLDLGTDGEVIP